MAPAKTISKTPAKKKQTKITGFTTNVKTKPKTNSRPNASILNYFKKAADEDLFIGDGAGVGVVEELDEDEEDIYGADDLFGGGIGKGGKGKRLEEEEEGRFNEDETPVKRRKLSNGGKEEREEQEAGSIISEKEMNPKSRSLVKESNTGTEEKATKPPATSQKPKPQKRSQPPLKKKNPFMDDSEDEDNNNDDTHNNPGREEVKNQGTSRTHSIKNTIARRDGLTFGEVAPLLREETSGHDLGKEKPEQIHGGPKGFVDETSDAEELYDLDDSYSGEEFREMRYMQEQARLEAREAGVDYEEPDVEDTSLMEECCPICNGSLAGVSESQATAHVNACLDGNPTPLPSTSPPSKTTSPTEQDNVSSPEIAKRFSKAAVPRPGQAIPFRLEGGSNPGDAGPSTSSAFTKLMSGHAEDVAWATAAAAEHSSRGMPAYKRTCPFYKIMPNFSICVDAFRYGAVEGCKAYFLSHFHSDHYIGLTAKWTHGPIYCSRVTGSLVKSQLKTAAKYVIELEFDEKVPVPDTNGVFVTMIPANHCPGSSLFLFEKVIGGGRTQRILHCGDFRACRDHITHPSLRPNLFNAVEGRIQQQKIDVCYLDTTYLNPRYSFPPQDDVIKACAELCVALNEAVVTDDESKWNSVLRKREGGAPNWLHSVSKFFNKAGDETKKNNNNPANGNGKKAKEEQDRNIPKTKQDPNPTPTPNAFTAIQSKPSPPRNRLLIVCGTYSIGKERICKAIAQALHTKIFAGPAKIRMCQQLDDPELAALMTSDPREAQVHMQMLMEIRAETLTEYLELHRGSFSRVVGFRPSGWNYRPGSASGSGNGQTPSKSAAAAVAKVLGTASANGGGGGNGSGVKNVTANMAPGSVPTTHLLHGPGWRTRFSVGDLTPQRGSGKEAMCFGVPYSEHSSFRELALFLMALRIERVVPTVNVGSEQSRKRMKAWTDRWLTERRRGGIVEVLVEEEEEAGRELVELWEGKDGKGGGVYW